MLPFLFMLTAPLPLTHSDLKLQCRLLVSPPTLWSLSIDWRPLGSSHIYPAPQHLQFHRCLNLFSYLNTSSGFSLSWRESLWESVPSCLDLSSLLPLSSHGHHSNMERVLGDKCPAQTDPTLLIKFSHSLWGRDQSCACNHTLSLTRKASLLTNASHRLSQSMGSLSWLLTSPAHHCLGVFPLVQILTGILSLSQPVLSTLNTCIIHCYICWIQHKHFLNSKFYCEIFQHILFAKYSFTKNICFILYMVDSFEIFLFKKQHNRLWLRPLYIHCSAYLLQKESIYWIWFLLLPDMFI